MIEKVRQKWLSTYPFFKSDFIADNVTVDAKGVIIIIVVVVKVKPAIFSNRMSIKKLVALTNSKIIKFHQTQKLAFSPLNV